MTEPEEVGRIVTVAVDLLRQKPGYTAWWTTDVVRRELAERLFRELRAEGRLTPP